MSQRYSHSDIGEPRPIPRVQDTSPRPQVSVVIASYNMGKYLSQAIQSVLDQPDASHEVIVVDDGSTDETQTVLRAFRDDPRITIISQDNQGQPRAKNAGILASRGHYIAFCDADDYWLPNKLATQLPLFENNPRVGIVHGSAHVLMPDGSMHHRAVTDPQVFRGSLFPELFNRNLVGFGTSITRRECFEQHGGFNDSLPMGIDWDLWLRLAVHWEFDYALEPTSVRRLWEGQMSENWEGRYDCALRIMDSFLINHPGLIPQHFVDYAYADTYRNLALYQLRGPGSRKFFETIRLSLRCRWNHWPTWRMLIMLPYSWLRYRMNNT